MTTAFTTTDLSRRARAVLDYARQHPRTGALIRHGEDGSLWRLVPAGDLADAERARAYVDMLVPLAVRGVAGETAADFPGLGWLVHLPAGARRQFVQGALERLVLGFDEGSFAELERWIAQWQEEAHLERAGILEQLRRPDQQPATTGRPQLPS